MKKKEIELRFFVGNSAHNIIDEVNNQLRYKLIKEVVEEDIYFTSKHKDFINTEECLRIREVNGICEITWKPPTTKQMLDKKSYWKQEINLNLHTDQKENAKALLKRLDFVECSTVRKRRYYFRIDEESLLTLDYIADLGWFVEIETMSNNKSSSLVKNRLIAEKLNLEINRAINIPYRDLVKKTKNHKSYLEKNIAYLEHR